MTPAEELELLNAAIAKPVGQKAHAENAFLMDSGVPPGLREEIDTLVDETPMRYWLIDNSESMRRKDGRKIVENDDGTLGEESCRRFDELTATLKWHAHIAEHLGAWTQFRLMNAAMGCQQNVTVGARAGCGLSSFDKLCASEPHGDTPLNAALAAVTADIARVADALRAANKRAVVVIATDGEPSDGDCRDALHALSKLPVTVRVRVCTNKEGVLEYWNTVDKTCESSLDVMDDVFNEALEVSKFNNWLTYSPLLHHIREFGCQCKVVDHLDERTLTPAEIREFVLLVFGKANDATLPDPETDLPMFSAAVTKLINAAPPLWNLIMKKKTPWIDLKRGRRGSASCALS